MTLSNIQLDSTSSSLGGSAQPSVSVGRLDFLPVALAMLRKMRVAEIVDAAVSKPFKNGPSVGTCVEAMVLNILEGRVALYKMESWLKALEIGSLWGADVQPEMFTDDRLARALDACFDASLETMQTQVVAGLRSSLGVSLDELHGDSTSLKTYGVYDVDDEAPGPRAEFGFSKDHRPDLRQFNFALTVQKDGIPIVSTLHDGNTADPAMHRAHLALLAQSLPDLSASTYVGDSKLCDATTLGQLRSQGLHVTTLMPKTFRLHDELIEQAIAQRDEWALLYRTPGKTSEDEESEYHGVAIACSLKLKWPEGNRIVERESQFHALVVHSSELAKKHAQSFAQVLARRRREMEALRKPFVKEKYACETDARAAMERFFAAHTMPGWSWDGQVERHETERSLGRRGRRKKGEVKETEIHYEVNASLKEDETTRQEETRSHGLFVLLTSHTIGADHPPSRVLAEYRGQHEVEQGFRWIKGTAMLGPLLLKTPHRIEALAWVFTLALTLYRVLQWKVRSELRRREETIPGNNRVKTNKPTTEVVMSLFEGINIVTITLGDAQHKSLVGIKPIHQFIVDLLALTDEHDPFVGVLRQFTPPTKLLAK